MKNVLTEKRFRELIGSFKHLSPIAIFGDIGIDKYTFGSVKRISPEAPVPILEVSEERLKLGLAANISHNLQTLGVSSTLCGVVGQDMHGDHFVKLLQDSGLSPECIVKVSGRPTVFKERVTTKTQQICRIDYERSTVIDSDTEKRILQHGERVIEDHGAVIIEDYAKGMVTQKVAAFLIAKCKEAGKLVAIDPGRKTPPHFYKGASLIKPNLEEARVMASLLGYPHEEYSAVAEILVDKLQLDKLVITLGEKGMALIDTKDKGELKVIPTVAQQVFDVSGAGDTAISLLTAGLLAGASLEEAAWLGNCGAGVVVAKIGTATVSLEELERFYLNLIRNDAN